MPKKQNDAADQYRDSESRALSIPVTDSVSLANELETARRILSTLLEAGDSTPGYHATIRDYLRVVKDLSAAEQSRRERYKEVVERAEMIGTARRWVGIICEHLEHAIPNEDTRYRVIDAMLAEMMEAMPSPPQLPSP